jgi:dUTP pyrophosphatase
MRGFYYVKDECAVSNAKSRAIPLPSRGTTKAAGYDFYSPNDFVIEPGQTCMIWTDIKALFSEDEVLKIYPRSSMSVQRNLVLKNTVGIIDSDYYGNKSNDGNIGIALWNTGNISQSVKQGEKIAQGIFEKYYTTTEANLISERQGGFGSTGL